MVKENNFWTRFFEKWQYLVRFYQIGSTLVSTPMLLGSTATHGLLGSNLPIQRGQRLRSRNYSRSNLIKSDQISSFFKTSGPEITFFDQLWQFVRIWRNKKKCPCEECTTATSELGTKDKIWLFQKNRDFDLAYGANWSHMQLDITWLSQLIKITQK